LIASGPYLSRSHRLFSVSPIFLFSGSSPAWYRHGFPADCSGRISRAPVHRRRYQHCDGVMARWGSFWLGMMFLLWFLVLHSPRVAMHPHSSCRVVERVHCLGNVRRGLDFSLAFAARAVVKEQVKVQKSYKIGSYGPLRRLTGERLPDRVQNQGSFLLSPHPGLLATICMRSVYFKSVCPAVCLGQRGLGRARHSFPRRSASVR